MLLQINRRLLQLKGSPDSSILAVGDLYQLQPVAQPHVFGEVSDSYARLHSSGSLWIDEFLPARASEQGNVIGLVSVYIYPQKIVMSELGI